MRSPPQRWRVLRFRSGGGLGWGRARHDSAAVPLPQTGTGSSQSLIYRRAKLCPWDLSTPSGRVMFSSFLMCSPKPWWEQRCLYPTEHFPPQCFISGQWAINWIPGRQVWTSWRTVHGFPAGWEQGCCCFSERLLMIGNLSIRWGKWCYTHTASISRIPARQHRLQSESMGVWGGGGWK